MSLVSGTSLPFFLMEVEAHWARGHLGSIPYHNSRAAYTAFLGPKGRAHSLRRTYPMTREAMQKLRSIWWTMHSPASLSSSVPSTTPPSVHSTRSIPPRPLSLASRRPASTWPVGTSPGQSGSGIARARAPPKVGGESRRKGVSQTG